MKTVAVAMAGLAAALVVGGGQNLLRARLGCPTASNGRPSASTGRRARRGVRLGLAGLSPRSRAAVSVAAGVVTGLAISGPGLALLGGATAGLVVATRLRAITTRRRHNTESTVSEACLALAAELRSGAHPRQALSAVAAEWPDLFGAAARRAQVGGEVASALRDTAKGPGMAALSAVAAGWEVSEQTGAALADVVTAVADALRADSAARREAAAQLSSVRVTARLLAVLPVGTLLLLSGGDGAAIQFLLSAPYGLACLGGATFLVASGLWWIDQLVRSANTSSWS